MRRHPPNVANNQLLLTTLPFDTAARPVGNACERDDDNDDGIIGPSECREGKLSPRV